MPEETPGEAQEILDYVNKTIPMPGKGKLITAIDVDYVTIKSDGEGCRIAADFGVRVNKHKTTCENISHCIKDFRAGYRAAAQGV